MLESDLATRQTRVISSPFSQIRLVVPGLDSQQSQQGCYFIALVALKHILEYDESQNLMLFFW